MIRSEQSEQNRDEQVKPGSLHAPTRRARFGRWLASHGWAHCLLICGSAAFLYPFMWMVFTSVKTDEEIPDKRFLPTIPTFRATSPWVRPAPTPDRPHGVSELTWNGLLPQLVDIARAALPAPDQAAPVDAAIWAEASAVRAVSHAIARLRKDLWTGDPAALTAAFRAEIMAGDGRSLRDARSASIGRLVLKDIQLKTLDQRVVNLVVAARSAGVWTIESGAATLVPGPAGTRVDYDLSTGTPLVLRCDLALPDGFTSANLHKLIVGYLPDDSWHRLDVTLDLGGTHWVGQRTTWIAQHQAASLIMQPPTFDDSTYKARLWVPLRAEGASAAAAAGGPAVLRLTVEPSGTLTAIAGKAQRNYLRALWSMPFWIYVGNSLLLVLLVMAGSLFSSAFVAYAFARLRWPGRGVAFVLLLATMMLPSQVTMIPSFLVWKTLGWYNTLNPLWIGSWFGTAFFIFLMTQQMKTIPKELEEAARIDGLNAVQTWWYIILPQVKPTLAGVAIMSFTGTWNEFMAPLIYLRDADRFPLSLGLFGVRVDVNFASDLAVQMAGSLLMTVPVIVIFFCFQRYFIQGMTMTGMKG